MFSKRFVFRFVACVVLFAQALLPVQVSALTIGEERKIGEQLLFSIRRELPVLDDPDISAYINALGHKVLENIGPQYFDYRFFVVKSDQFNAFAAPAGLVFFYSGLIETMRTENELLSVLAHEIGHVRRFHLVLYVTLFLGFSLLAGGLGRLLPHFVLSGELFYRLLEILPLAPETLLGVLVSAPLLVLLIVWFRFVFGYFMRNFERQADLYVFRVQGTGRPLVASFERIATLGGGNREEKNWHHFGLGERVAFLERCETDPTLIVRHDRKVRWSLIACFLAIGLLVFGLYRVDGERLAGGNEIRYTEAVLAQKMRLEPANSVWPLVLGDFLQSRRMESKAVAAYEQALKLAPDNAEISNNLAWLLLTAHDPAVRDAGRALTLAASAALATEHGPVRAPRATASWANGLIEEALATEARAVRLDPRNRAYYLRQMETFRTRTWGEAE